MIKKGFFKKYKQIIVAQREAYDACIRDGCHISKIYDTGHNAYDQCIALGKQHGLSDDDIDRYYYKALDALDREAGIYSDDDPVVDMTIKKIRKSWGMTRREFANFLGVSVKLVKAIEHDERDHQESIWDLCTLICDRLYDIHFDRRKSGDNGDSGDIGSICEFRAVDHVTDSN